MSSTVHEETISKDLANELRKIRKEDDLEDKEKLIEGICRAADSIRGAISGDTIKIRALRDYIQNIADVNDDKISKRCYEEIEKDLRSENFISAQKKIESQDIDFDFWRMEV